MGFVLKQMENQFSDFLFLRYGRFDHLNTPLKSEKYHKLPDLDDKCQTFLESSEEM